MCHVLQDDTAEAGPSVAALRAAARKVQKLTWTRNDAEPLAQVAALVAWALGRLHHWAPTEGYHPLRAEHRGSVKMMDVHGVVAQLLGLLHPQQRADAVAERAVAAIEEAITYVYLTRISYDAWQPGMASGKGRCMLVKTTTLGMAKAGGALRDAVPPGSMSACSAGAPLPPWKRRPEPAVPPVAKIGSSQGRADACAPANKLPQPAVGSSGSGTPDEPRSSSAAHQVDRPAAPPAVRISNWQDGADAFAAAFQTVGKAVAESGKMRCRAPADPKASKATHSPDFTSVDWFGTRYIFAKGNQAASVRVLWAAWEAGGHSLTQETIGTRVSSDASRFELAKVFRHRRPDGGYEPHPAWGTLIQPDSKGSYRLVPPTSA